VNSGINDLDEVALAVLMACQQRGPLTAEAIGRLVAPLELAPDALLRLAGERYLDESAGEFCISESGRRFLDRIFEGIQGEFAPDDPLYVRRYRREKPSLPFEADTIWAEAICVNVRLPPDALRPLVPQFFCLDLIPSSWLATAIGWC